MDSGRQSSCLHVIKREARGKDARGKERSRGRARARGAAGEPASAGGRSITLNGPKRTQDKNLGYMQCQKQTL